MNQRVFILDTYLWEESLVYDYSHKSFQYNKSDFRTLYIDPLSTDWHSPLAIDHFRSGCAPLEALAQALDILQKQNENIVLIKGRDFLKSEYTSNQRKESMLIYGEKHSLPEAYTKLTQSYIKEMGFSEEQFFQLRDLLFENYLHTYKKENIDYEVSSKWLQPVTSYFRGVDCANPSIDFHGEIILVNEQFLKDNNINGEFIEVVDCQTRTIEDGPAHIDELSTFNHLGQVYSQICKRTSFNLANEMEKDNCILDLYTCYPIVPLAFIQKSSLATSFEEIKSTVL